MLRFTDMSKRANQQSNYQKINSLFPKFTRNALARAVCHYQLGEIRDRSYEDLQYRASGLTLVTAAIVLWNTVYLEEAVKQLRSEGVIVKEELLQHVSLLLWAGNISI